MTMTARRYRVVPYIPFSWESQRDQYPADHEPGFRYTVEHVEAYPDHPIDCLVLYGGDRKIAAILNHFPLGVPGWEEPRAMMLYVDPARRRQGLGTRMLREAERLWGPVDWDAQHVTPEGRALAESYRKD